MKIKSSIVLIIFSLFIVRSNALAQIRDSVLGPSFVASYNKNKVDSLVKIIDTSAKLIAIKSDDVFNDGTSSSWIYLYRGLLNYYFHTTSIKAVYDSTSSIDIIGLTIISKPWFDSDSALSVANKLGGNSFTISHPHYRITVELGEALVPNTILTWTIYYKSIDDPSMLAISMNVTDGRPTSVKIVHQDYPVDFLVNQNYPNPFNPKTTIVFSLTRSAIVNLEVFDFLGRRICSLLSQVLPQGSYKAEWDGTNQASGVYYYRLQVDDRYLSKHMILLK